MRKKRNNLLDHSVSEYCPLNINNSIRILFCGDVMSGRGIDQVLSYPSNPQLHEPFVKDAREYVFLAEKKNGKIDYPVNPNYIWGDALSLWEQYLPDIKIFNLETAITQSHNFWPEKGIHYRMHPFNIDVLIASGVDVCTLANNHTLDWGYEGLDETLSTLQAENILFSGAGKTIKEAMMPAIVQLADHQRILIFSISMASSGVPFDWGATENKQGVSYFSNMNDEVVTAIEKNINQYREPNDLIICSIHWGSNWGYTISESYRHFAHTLIDKAQVDVIFGHSSHHPRPIELYRGKPILYGCGDFINDYEGIQGYESYRGDLTFMYFLDFDKESLALEKITLIPMQIKKFRLHNTSQADCQWMHEKLKQYSINNIQFTMENNVLIYSLTNKM